MIEVPAIIAEGFVAMRRGYALRSPQYPLGFCFCPYKSGPARENFLVGCARALGF